MSKNSSPTMLLQTERRPRNNTDSGGISGGGAAAGLALGQQQQQLQDKLKDLQQKKRSMDHLLAQLETLRSHRLQVMNNGQCTSNLKSHCTHTHFLQIMNNGQCTSLQSLHIHTHSHTHMLDTLCSHCLNVVNNGQCTEGVETGGQGAGLWIKQLRV